MRISKYHIVPKTHGNVTILKKRLYSLGMLHHLCHLTLHFLHLLLQLDLGTFHSYNFFLCNCKLLSCAYKLIWSVYKLFFKCTNFLTSFTSGTKQGSRNSTKSIALNTTMPLWAIILV